MQKGRGAAAGLAWPPLTMPTKLGMILQGCCARFEPAEPGSVCSDQRMQRAENAGRPAEPRSGFLRPKTAPASRYRGKMTRMTESATTPFRRPHSKPMPEDTGDSGDFQARSLVGWKRAAILHLVDLKPQAVR